MTKYVLTETNQHINWEDLQAQLEKERDSRGGEWLLDLSRLSYIDSLSIGNLLATYGQLNQRSTRLKLLVRKGSLVERLLLSAKLDRIMTLNVI